MSRKERQVEEEKAFPSVILAEEGSDPWTLRAEPATDMESVLMSIADPEGKRHAAVLTSCASLAEFAHGVLAMIQGKEKAGKMAADDSLSPYLAIFSYHVNDAGKKAREAFIRAFGQEGWDMHIQPFEDRGIMSLFNVTPTFHTMFYVTAVMLFASGDAELRPRADGTQPYSGDAQ